MATPDPSIYETIRLDDETKRHYDPQNVSLYKTFSEQKQQPPVDLSQSYVSYQSNQNEKFVATENLQSEKNQNDVIACNDHLERQLSKSTEVISATRFCSKCNKFICDKCVIDYHSDHVKNAKTLIDDYCNNIKEELIQLRNKLAELERGNFRKDSEFKINSIKEAISKEFASKKNKVSYLVSRIKEIDSEFDRLKTVILANIEKFYRVDCYTKLSNQYNLVKQCRL